jgi:hypothetical protein
LAEEFQINRTTVLAHLRRAGVPRQLPKIGEAWLPEVIERYARGESLVQVARHFELSAATFDEHEGDTMREHEANGW